MDAVTEFKVQIDTGSTDLWVNPSAQKIQTTQKTDVVVSEVYGKGNVTGNVAFAQLEVGGFTVPNQGKCALPSCALADIDLPSFTSAFLLPTDVCFVEVWL